MVKFVDETSDSQDRIERGRRICDLASKFFEGCSCKVDGITDSHVFVRRDLPGLLVSIAQINIDNDSMRLIKEEYFDAAKRFGEAYEQAFPDKGEFTIITDYSRKE